MRRFAVTTERYVLGYSVTRDHWFVEDTTTGKARRFATRDKALAVLEEPLPPPAIPDCGRCRHAATYHGRSLPVCDVRGCRCSGYER